MLLSDIVRSFRERKVGPGDEIVLNGGEPTLYPELLSLLNHAVETGAKVILFTNGRRLSTTDFAEAIIATGVNRITIPLYGQSPIEHDSLTKSPGSFDQTLVGVQRLFEFKNAGSPIEIELKCLFCRPCLITNPQLVDFIAHEFGRPDRFVISGLIVSEKVLEQRSTLVPDWSELVVSANDTLKRAKTHSFNVVLSLFPLCALHEELLDFYLQQELARRLERLICTTQPYRNSSTSIYFDPLYPCGLPSSEQADKVQHPRCRGCAISQYCHAKSGFLDTIFPEVRY